ncbi:MAG TPA: hypothetical protein VMV10_05905 [Pirellulales bacterium]|nr:hypothetical protein [Pirellulales bacterium]
MTTICDIRGEANIARLNAFLDQFPDGGCDPDFDESTEELERQFAELRLTSHRH